MGEPIPFEAMPPFINGMALEAINLIVMMQTQWNYVSTGMGAIKQGLNYQMLEVVARVNNIKLTETMFSIVRQLEIKILKIEGDKNGSS